MNGKSYQAAFAESEAQYRLMADTVPQILWTTDATGRAEFFNRQWFEYTGAQEMPATAVHAAGDYVHPDDAPATLAAFEHAMASGTPFAVEHRIRNASGDYRWFLVRANPYRAPETGEIVRWFGASVDIDDRRQAEAALHHLNMALESAVAERTAERDRMWDSSPDLMLVIDFEGFLRRVNPAWTRLLGYEPEELIGHHVNEFVVPDHHEATTAAYQRAAAGGETAVENRYRHKDGSTRWISWIAAPAGGMTYATGRDVTAARQARTELEGIERYRREADALYRAYFENTAEALFVVGVQPDGSFTVEDLNPAHQAGIGFRLEDVRGKRVDDVLPSHTAELVISYYQHVVASGEVYQYGESFELQGQSKYWDTILVPVRDAQGNITKLIGSSRDLSRQVAAEEQLRHVQKMEAIGQLTGGIAHDFNNLLTPIVGTLDMLQRRSLGGEREQRLIGGAVQSAERAKLLVQRLLAFARRQPIHPVALDLGELTRGMAELIASTTGPQIKVVVDTPADLPSAKADPNQLEMALLNLAVNARDAMPEGGTLRITVDTKGEEEPRPAGLAPGNYLRLSVADTGTGMDAATLARAVEPFFSTKGIGKGTGLGLSMVHGLADQLGGTMVIHSTPGLGTNVELWLPQSAEKASVSTVSDREVPKASVKGVALIVDDEEIVRQSTADMLRELEYEVIEASSAEEALGLLKRGVSVDLVITDHLMPAMTGSELARSLRSRYSALPILLITGYADATGIAPDLPFLTKPFRINELAGRLREISQQGAS